MLRGIIRTTAVAALLLASAASAQSLMPQPSGRPFEIDFAADPVLQLRRDHIDYESFRDVVASAVVRHPGTAEAAATEDEALEVLSEARSASLPTVDATVTYYRVIAR